MADDDETDAPAVELGEATPVEGAPLARVAARFTWGIQRSEIARREGETTIRTPDGPRALGDLLAATDVPYFASRREFLDAVRAQIGDGPVPAGDAEAATADDEAETAEVEPGTTEAEAGTADDETTDDETEE